MFPSHKAEELGPSFLLSSVGKLDFIFVDGLKHLVLKKFQRFSNDSKGASGSNASGLSTLSVGGTASDATKNKVDKGRSWSSCWDPGRCACCGSFGGATVVVRRHDGKGWQWGDLELRK